MKPVLAQLLLFSKLVAPTTDHQPAAPKVYAGIPLEALMNGISWAESRHRDDVVSPRNAYTRWQIRRIAIRDCNRRHGTHYRLTNIQTNAALARWMAIDRFEVGWNFFSNLEPDARLDHALSAYNAGETYVLSNGIRPKYVRDVRRHAK